MIRVLALILSLAASTQAGLLGQAAESYARLTAPLLAGAYRQPKIATPALSLNPAALLAASAPKYGGNRYQSPRPAPLLPNLYGLGPILANVMGAAPIAQNAYRAAPIAQNAYAAAPNAAPALTNSYQAAPLAAPVPVPLRTSNTFDDGTPLMSSGGYGAGSADLYNNAPSATPLGGGYGAPALPAPQLPQANNYDAAPLGGYDGASLDASAAPLAAGYDAPAAPLLQLNNYGAAPLNQADNYGAAPLNQAQNYGAAPLGGALADAGNYGNQLAGGNSYGNAQLLQAALLDASYRAAPSRKPAPPRRPLLRPALVRDNYGADDKLTGFNYYHPEEIKVTPQSFGKGHLAAAGYAKAGILAAGPAAPSYSAPAAQNYPAPAAQDYSAPAAPALLPTAPVFSQAYDGPTVHTDNYGPQPAAPAYDTQSSGGYGEQGAGPSYDIQSAGGYGSLPAAPAYEAQSNGGYEQQAPALSNAGYANQVATAAYDAQSGGGYQQQPAVSQSAGGYAAPAQGASPTPADYSAADNGPSGHEAGFREGQKAGYESGHAAGVAEGRQKGHQLGKSAGNAIGRQEGLAQGTQIGLKLGKKVGVQIGKSDGFRLGHEAGLKLGHKVGYKNGKQEGYQNGYDKGFNEAAKAAPAADNASAELNAKLVKADYTAPLNAAYSAPAAAPAAEYKSS